MQRLFVSDIEKMVKKAVGPSVSSVDVLFEVETGRVAAVSVGKKKRSAWYPFDGMHFESGEIVLGDAGTGSAEGQVVLELPVKTVSGDDVGVVRDAVVVWETGRLHQLVVRGGLLSLLRGDVLVSWSDVVEIREDVVVVKDRIVKRRAAARVVEMSRAAGLASGA